MSDQDRYINIKPNINNYNEEQEYINKTSIAKVLLLFYVLISGSPNNLMGKQLKKFIEDSRIAQHFIAFLTLFVLLISFEHNLFDPDNTLTITDALIYTVIGYTWFILSTKLDAQWNIMLILILIGIYVMDTYFRNQEKEANLDPNLTDIQKLKIIKSNNAYRTYATSFAILVTILGTILYSDRKAEQYGGSYDIFSYLLY